MCKQNHNEKTPPNPKHNNNKSKQSLINEFLWHLSNNPVNERMQTLHIYCTPLSKS